MTTTKSRTPPLRGKMKSLQSIYYSENEVNIWKIFLINAVDLKEIFCTIQS